MVQSGDAAVELLLEGKGHAPVREELLPHAFYGGRFVRRTDLLECRDLRFKRGGVGDGDCVGRALHLTKERPVPYAENAVLIDNVGGCELGWAPDDDRR